MIFGASFSPEYCEYLGVKDPVQILKFAHRKLSIKDIRLGLRWNTIDNGNGLSLDYYRKYLDYLFKNNLDVCLNIGPVKVFRWPEEHIPSYLESNVTTNIDSDSKISEISKEYILNLLSLLEREYGSYMNKVTFQIENEAFNRFGHIRAKISPSHVFDVTQILFKKFQKSKLLMNSAGRTNLRKIISLFKNFRESKTINPKSLTLGINYYFKLPHTLPFFKTFDPIQISYPWDMSIKELHRRSEEVGFNIEVTEGQFEPWGVQVTPGNSYEDFKYLVERSEEILLKNDERAVLRLWGIEEFAKKFLDGTAIDVHREIAKEIKYCNSTQDYNIIDQLNIK